MGPVPHRILFGEFEIYNRFLQHLLDNAKLLNFFTDDQQEAPLTTLMAASHSSSLPLAPDPAPALPWGYSAAFPTKKGALVFHC